MAIRNVIRRLVRDKGKGEDELLAELLEECGHEQKAIAESLNISQASVSVECGVISFVQS
jgi:DNA-binding MarR family transcriptional regulator